MTSVSRAVARRISNDDDSFEASLKILTGAMTLAGACVCGLYWYTQRLNDQDIALEHKQPQQQASHNQDNHSMQRESELSANNSSSSESIVPKSTAGISDTVPPTTTSESVPAAASENNIRKDSSSQEVTTKSTTTKEKKKKKAHLSMMQSIGVLASNEYLLNVAVMVLSYGLTMEFTEIIWKSTVKKAFPIKTDYLNFMGRYSMLVGIAASVMMVVGSNTVKILGWRAGALVTPCMMGLLAAPFFLCIIGGGLNSQTSLLIAVYVGLVQNVLSKATKYAIFDPTKEMTYIPLDQESKTKGKAAIDVLGARMGKSGGALAQQILVLVFGSIVQGAPLVAVLFYVVIFAWIGEFY